MALFRVSGPLCRELARVIPSRPFALEFWDGGTLPATEPDSPTFFVRRPSAIAHALRAPGPLGLGRAYVEGSLDVDDLDKAFIVVDDWVPPPIASRRQGAAARDARARRRARRRSRSARAPS